MTVRFNPKQYRGKNRLFRKVPGTSLIARILKWDGEKLEYRDPPSGPSYLARRYEIDDNDKTLKARTFSSLEEAKKWQAHIGESRALIGQVNESSTCSALSHPFAGAAPSPGPSFREVYEEWKRRNFDRLARGTQINYEKYIRLHFSEVMDVSIHAITPRFIDAWLDDRKANIDKFGKGKRRRCFLHELSIFSVVLKYYHEYHDDRNFVMPLRQRHREAAIVGRKFRDNAQKDLTVEEFNRFRQALLDMKTSISATLAAMATVQYFQALRVSEVAALHWEDVLLDWRNPKNSRIIVHRHIVYIRRKGSPSFLEEGFKNASREDSVKEQPLFPESFSSLKSLFYLHAKGIVFRNGNGAFFDYRQIQSHYDRAFVAAGLPYRGTHVLRHGGTRNLYNETGDLAVAQQLLGNADLGSTLVYAKRHKSALTKVADAHWNRFRTDQSFLSEAGERQLGL